MLESVKKDATPGELEAIQHIEEGGKLLALGLCSILEGYEAAKREKTSRSAASFAAALLRYCEEEAGKAREEPQ